MLNVLRHLPQPERPFNVGWVCFVAGVLSSIGLLAWQAHVATLEMPQGLLEKMRWEELLQQTQPAQSEMDALQFSVTQATQRLEALEKRQSVRLDLQEIQARLFLEKNHRQFNALQMQKLHWQAGRFEWQGTSLSPNALQALLLQISSFERWQTQPQLVQMQSTASANGGADSVSKTDGTGVVFKLEGQIQSDGMAALTSNSATQQP